MAAFCGYHPKLCAYWLLFLIVRSCFVSNWSCIVIPNWLVCATMEFDLEGFVSGRDKLEGCTTENLLFHCIEV